MTTTIPHLEPSFRKTLTADIGAGRDTRIGMPAGGALICIEVATLTQTSCVNPLTLLRNDVKN